MKEAEAKKKTISLYLPPELHAWLEQRAKAEHRTRSNLIVKLLEELKHESAA